MMVFCNNLRLCGFKKADEKAIIAGKASYA